MDSDVVIALWLLHLPRVGELQESEHPWVGGWLCVGGGYVCVCKGGHVCVWGGGGGGGGVERVKGRGRRVG